MADEHDLVVIGGGPGGYAAALYGAAAGLSVALVERAEVGGTCLHRGCIPAKQLLETATVYRTVARAGDFGVVADPPSVDLPAAQARKREVVGQLHRGLGGLLKKRGVEVVAGTGTLGPDRTVTVASEDGSRRQLVGRHVVLATGSLPRTLDGFEVDGTTVLTSDEVLELQCLPASAAVIGGGAIGCEFASLLGDLGTDVTVLEALPQLLAGVDGDVAEVVARSFQRRGITVHTGVAVHGHDPADAKTTVRFGRGESVTVEAVIMAVGRRPLAETLGLEGTAVQLDDRGFVAVDEYLRTGEEGVYALGDLVATPQLAHVGFAEAIVAVRHMLGEAVAPVEYDKVPWCIYSHPEVAFAGLTESAAREAGHDVVVTRHRFNANSRALVVGEPEGLVKVVAEREAGGRVGRLLGVHLVGPWVTEQLAEGYLAINWEATPEDIGPLVHPHPTLSETFGETVLALTGRGLHA